MATLSHEAFRRLVEEFGGVDEYYTEMINAPTLLQHGPFEKYYLLNGPCPEKIVWQLTAHDADSMAGAVSLLAALGGIGIDINMGCSAPEIVHSGAGIAWMLKPQSETLAMVRNVKEALVKAAPKMRLSVKLRLGDEKFVPEKFFDFCRLLADCGVQQFVLHPRTQKEKLARPPRRFFVQQLASLLKPEKIPVIYNGNVKDKASAELSLKECPDAQGIMISRAAVQKPWIFSQLKNGGAPKVDLMQTGLDYIKNLQIYQPPEFFKTRMQRFFAYYCDNFSFGHYIKTKMLNCQTAEEAEMTFRSYFDEVPDERNKAV